MRAVALSILGPGPDADDAMQDAALTALRGIADVGDPQAVSAWLRMIVRNRRWAVQAGAARMGVRARVTRGAGESGYDAI
jgi:RNA polymerase sigma-70 factor (ECF subfamily)